MSQTHYDGTTTSETDCWTVLNTGCVEKCHQIVVHVLCIVLCWHWLSESRKGVMHTYLLGWLKCCWWFHRLLRRSHWHFWPMNDLQQLFDFYPLHKFNSLWAAQKNAKHTRWSTHDILSRTHTHTQHCTTLHTIYREICTYLLARRKKISLLHKKQPLTVNWVNHAVIGDCGVCNVVGVIERLWIIWGFD